ncbi:hypothetical protein K1X76_10230 [bacterium]|nr:hypothetical protein [bacterium]
MPENKQKLIDAKRSFIDGAGSISVSLLGLLNRVCGQIFALLYLSPEPLSLDDIVSELGVSKGNVSINIRLLEDYKLVKKIWVKGTRKDFYQAVDEIPISIIKEFVDKIRRNIHDSLDMISDCADLVNSFKKNIKDAQQKNEAEFMLKRFERVLSFYQGAGLLFNALYSGEKLDTSLLAPILSLKK